MTDLFVKAMRDAAEKSSGSIIVFRSEALNLLDRLQLAEAERDALRAEVERHMENEDLLSEEITALRNDADALTAERDALRALALRALLTLEAHRMGENCAACEKLIADLEAPGVELAASKQSPEH